MAWEVPPDFGKEPDAVGMGWSSTDALGCGKNGAREFGSELLAMAEVQSRSVASALPELRCLDLVQVPAVVLGGNTLGCLYKKTRNGPVWRGLVSSSDEGRGLISPFSSPSANWFLSFWSVVASI